MKYQSEYKFMQQQGFKDFTRESFHKRFRALQFQPTIVGSLILISIFTQSATLFFILSVLLWINVLFPKANPFENLYNMIFASKAGHYRITPAPAPRRFAQGMAAVFTLIAGLGVLNNWTTIAVVFQVFLVIAFASLLFGKFCLGAYLYHLFKGNRAFANKTNPWSRRSQEQS